MEEMWEELPFGQLLPMIVIHQSGQLLFESQDHVKT